MVPSGQRGRWIHKIKRMYKATITWEIPGDSYNRGERIDSSKFGVDPGLPTSTISSEVSTSSEEAKRMPAYRCKKCRRIVAQEENLVGHEPGEGESCFEWKKRKNSKSSKTYDEHECSSIFVEPLQWMKSEIRICSSRSKKAFSLAFKCIRQSVVFQSGA
ncbi:hypothetical protein C5167_045565 [Papaver somniferum]|uniref:protein-tyrosine-phosphatase n=1 Tax=Papaver somniferum TaxID=3469 RepID=A0A4Y7LBA1_PAPSO|nr:hypothetical protein C5167_045565 [Papaver somniferum]